MSTKTKVCAGSPPGHSVRWGIVPKRENALREGVGQTAFSAAASIGLTLSDVEQMAPVAQKDARQVAPVEKRWERLLGKGLRRASSRAKEAKADRGAELDREFERAMGRVLRGTKTSAEPGEGA